MTTLVIFGLIAAVAAGVLLWPLLRWAQPSADQDDADVGVYADQLDEVERDRRAGLVPEAEAEAARVEIARRLLRAARVRRESSGGRGPRTAAAVLIVLLVPVLTIGVYARLGSPGYGDQPAAARANQAALAGELPVLLARAEERLRETPEDGTGWEVVAPVYLRSRRFDEAIVAYQNAIRLLGENARRLTGLGEAFTLRDQGLIGPDARAAFAKALALSPEAVSPQIYLAIAARQEGRPEAARAIWDALVARAAGNEPWLTIARNELALLDSTAAGSEAAPAAAEVPAVGPEAVESMVSRLALRLEQEGGSADEYIRLARSYVVLGRREEAVRTIERGLSAFEGEPDGEGALRAAARALDLAPN